MKKTFPLSQVYQLIEPGPVVLVSCFYKGKANVMTMSWLTMIDFEPPVAACIISDQNYSFELIKKSKELVLNIPSVELAAKIVGIGNTSGKDCDKFQKFQLHTEPATYVQAPLLADCYANLECRVVDMKMVKKYNMFIVEVLHGWLRPAKKRPKMLHHCGNGVFTVDGKVITLDSNKK